MIDTHAHIDGEAFDDDRAAMIQRAFDAGIEAIIIPAIEPSRYSNILSLCEQYNNLYCGMGIHPHNALEVNDTSLQQIRLMANHPKVKAIGEIGLDYYYDFAPKDIQKQAFIQQITIAKECNLPIIVHNRESDEDILTILEQEQDGTLQGVLHCFSSSVEVLKRTLDLGLHVSFTGNITYKKSTLSEVVAAAAPDKIMIETDSPYMTPVPFRGKRNEPSYVIHIAEKIAEIHNMSLESVLTMTTNTAKSLFRITLALLIGTCISLSSISLQAQDRRDSDEEDVEEQVDINPYPKFIGVGPSFGTNTIIETLVDSDRPTARTTDSYDGNPAYGFSFVYHPLQYIMIDLGILHSPNNSKLKLDTTQKDPDKYTMFNLSVRAIANPKNRVSFFGLAGVSLLAKSIYGVNGNPNFTDDNLLGFNAGLGFLVHIPTSFGLIVPIAEWRLDFELKDVVATTPSHPKAKDWGLVNKSTFYSLPRLSVIWYPSF